MNNSLIEVLIGWSFVVAVDLSVTYLFYNLANSVSKQKDNP